VSAGLAFARGRDSRWLGDCLEAQCHGRRKIWEVWCRRVLSGNRGGGPVEVVHRAEVEVSVRVCDSVLNDGQTCRETLILRISFTHASCTLLHDPSSGLGGAEAWVSARGRAKREVSK
jgi:hypothetical protein